MTLPQEIPHTASRHCFMEVPGGNSSVYRGALCSVSPRIAQMTRGIQHLSPKNVLSVFPGAAPGRGPFATSVVTSHVDSYGSAAISGEEQIYPFPSLSDHPVPAETQLEHRCCRTVSATPETRADAETEIKSLFGFFSSEPVSVKN